MNLAALDIPEDESLVPTWLEEQLVGLHLAELVVELEVLGAAAPAERSLDKIIGEQRSAVLRHGLSSLSIEQIQALLAQPRLLLELQERVFVEGGDYWQHVPLTPDHRHQTDATWNRLQAALLSAETESPLARPTVKLASRQHLLWPALILAAAAALLLMVFAFRPEPSPPGWGWNRPGALAENVTAPQYLEQLATAAHDWFKKRPQSPEQLSQRLREFRSGCETLIAAQHRPLAEQDRAWLVERCQAWKAKLDGHLTALEQGQPVDAVQAAADETVNALVKALQERAKVVG